MLIWLHLKSKVFLWWYSNKKEVYADIKRKLFVVCEKKSYKKAILIILYRKHKIRHWIENEKTILET